MYFDLIYSDLKSLSLQTEMLEACDWDEQELELVMQSASSYLNGLVLKDYRTWVDIKYSIKYDLQSMFNKKISCIIMNIVKLKKEEMLNLMELPEQ